MDGWLTKLPLLAENKVLIVQLGGLTPLIRQMLSPNVEVLQAILFDKLLEGAMCGKTHSMVISIFEDEAKGDEGLNVSAGTDHLNDDVEGRGEVGGLLAVCEEGLGCF